MTVFPGIAELSQEADEPLCIRFANTVGSRKAEHPSEYLKTPEDLTKWMTAQKLGQMSVDQKSLEQAIELRNALYGVLSATAAQAVPESQSSAVLSAWIAQACAGLRFGIAGGRAEWSLTRDGLDPSGPTNPQTYKPTNLDRALCLVALSAACLLSSPDASKIRECADATCGWMFLDRSKNHSRKWCDMSDCGNLAKARRYQAKKRQSK